MDGSNVGSKRPRNDAETSHRARSTAASSKQQSKADRILEVSESNSNQLMQIIERLAVLQKAVDELQQGSAEQVVSVQVHTLVGIAMAWLCARFHRELRKLPSASEQYCAVSVPKLCPQA